MLLFLLLSFCSLTILFILICYLYSYERKLQAYFNLDILLCVFNCQQSFSIYTICIAICVLYIVQKQLEALDLLYNNKKQQLNLHCVLEIHLYLLSIQLILQILKENSIIIIDLCNITLLLREYSAINLLIARNQKTLLIN